MLKVPKSNSAWLERYKLPKWGGAAPSTGFCSRARGAAAGLHGHDVMPRQHEKPTWRGMDLGDMTYKVYGPKKAFWKLMDLTKTSSQVNGPLVHLTLLENTLSKTLNQGSMHREDAMLLDDHLPPIEYVHVACSSRLRLLTWYVFTFSWTFWKIKARLAQLNARLHWVYTECCFF